MNVSGEGRGWRNYSDGDEIKDRGHHETSASSRQRGNRESSRQSRSRSGSRHRSNHRHRSRSRSRDVCSISMI